MNTPEHYIHLNNGVEMPQVGLGLYKHFMPQLAQTLRTAYDLGYRNFDTARHYYNEGDLAQALKETGIRREDVFITTKFMAHDMYWCGWHADGKRRVLNMLRRRSIRGAAELSFRGLDTDYIDLMLVHWPWPQFRDIYKHLASLMKEGRVRAIGVCSFLQPHLEALMESCDIVPAVNQFEISPLNTQKPLIAFCQSHGIAVEAMATFSHYRSREPRAEILQHQTLEAIAQAHNVTPAQVVLRWLVQQGIAIIPSSKSAEHLRQNIDLFGWSLTADEMARIDALDQGRWLNYDSRHTLRWL